MSYRNDRDDMLSKYLAYEEYKKDPKGATRTVIGTVLIMTVGLAVGLYFLGLWPVTCDIAKTFFHAITHKVGE